MQLRPKADPPGGDAETSPARDRRSRRRRVAYAALGVGVVLAVVAGVCVNDALDAPGPGGAQAKLARWGRCHGLGPVVSLVDNRHQRANPASACGATGRTLNAAPA
ncbi:hypothetical protein DN069_00855, partial [Streptacidiphilus pinicola]